MRRLPKIVLLMMISLLVTLALLLTALRLILPHINHWRATLVMQAVTASGLPIETSHLQAAWHNSGPVLQVHDLYLQLKNGDKLTVKHITMQLDIWRSLLHARWQFRELDFYQLSYQSDNPLNVHSAARAQDNEPQGKLSRLLFQQFNRFTLHDSTLNLLTATGQRVKLHIPQLSWLNSAQRHRAEGEISLSDLNGQQGAIHLRMDLYGAGTQSASGTIWLQADDMEVTPWLGRWVEQQTNNLSARASLQAWLQLKQGQIATADVWLADGKLNWQPAVAPVVHSSLSPCPGALDTLAGLQAHLPPLSASTLCQPVADRGQSAPVFYSQRPGTLFLKGTDAVKNSVIASNTTFTGKVSPAPARPKQHQLQFNNTSIHISPLAAGWQLAIAQTDITLDNQRWPVGAISIGWLPASDPSVAVNLPDSQQRQAGLPALTTPSATPPAATTQWRIRASQLELQHITPLLSLVQAVPPQVRLWQQLQPQGMLESVALDIPVGNPEHIRIQARWHNLSWQAWYSLPGVDRLAGEIGGSLAAGQLSLHLHKGTVSNPRMFQAPVPIEQATARLAWQHNDQGLTLMGRDIVICAPSLQFKGDFRYQHPRNAQPWLALLAGINLTDARQAWRYFPYDLTPYDPHYLINPGLATYLRQALQAGSAHNATLLFNGNPQRFPWPDNDGIFEVRVPVRNAQFAFDHQWPPLRNLALDLHFINDGMMIRAPSLQIDQIQAHNLHAEIPHYHQQRLLIGSSINSDAAAITRYFQQTPLHDSLAKTLQLLPLSGNISGRLNLAIPLQQATPPAKNTSASPRHDADQVQASGEVYLSSNTLNITALNQQLTDMKGRFSFNNNQLYGKGLQANWYGQPITLNFTASDNASSTSKSQADSQHNSWQITADVAGNWQASQMSGLVASLRQRLNGSIRWQSKFKINLPENSLLTASNKTPNNSPSYQLHITGNMNTLASRLPAPLHKRAGSALPFRLQAAGDLHQFILAGSIGGKTHFNSRWLLTPGLTLERGSLTSNSSQIPPLPTRAGVSLELPAIDGTLFLTLLQGGMTDQVQSSSLLNVPLIAHTPRLEFAGQHWQQASLVLQPLSNGNKFSLQAKQINATLTQYRHAPWLAEISYLSYHPDSALSPLLSGNAVADKARPYNSYLSNPENWPDIQLRCASCWLWGKHYGQISGTLQRQGDTITLSKASLDNGITRIHLTGTWQRKGSHSHSAIKGQLRGKKLDMLTRFLDLGVPIQQSPFSLDYQLNWQGLPWQPELASLDGTLQASLDKGKIVDVDSGHAGQLLSLFSLDALLRRLRFDFRDNFSDGFYFDRISSHATLHNGVLHTDDTFIKGLSADIAIRGKVDFSGDKLNLTATVAPQLASAVGVATAFAVNPLAGAAVYAASKVLSPLWGKVSLLHYQISGSVEKPTVSEAVHQPRTTKSLAP